MTRKQGDPLSWVFSGTNGFVCYRGSKPVFQIVDPQEAIHTASRLLSFPQQIDGELIKDQRRRVDMAQCLLKVATATN